MKRLLSVIVWSVIAGAFIGPGTVTTAASAGAGFGLSLIWALVFSTVACLVLQEASARVTVISGKELGAALRVSARSSTGGALMLVLVLGAIVLGCAAYQAGNILGAVVGASRLTGLPTAALTLAIGGLAALLLWLGTPRVIAILFSLLVAVMGVAFLVTAVSLEPSLSELLRGALVPALPGGAGMLVLGLIGTTVVPYNLFLGSGLARGQSLQELRFGLPVAVISGGVISIGVLIVGSAVSGAFSFDGLTSVLSQRLGGWAELLFGLGLFAAGFSSAISAPWAAAMTTRSLFASDDDSRWRRQSWRYRSVWLGVLLVGIAFGLTDVRPIPAIILAQVLNGLLLPIVATFLLVTANNRSLLGDSISSPLHATLMVAVVLVTLVLGITSLARAGASIVGAQPPDELLLLTVAGVIGLVAAAPVIRAVSRARGR
jgi:Mn2+/Fe2+ NRAMP family transporter